MNHSAYFAEKKKTKNTIDRSYSVSVRCRGASIRALRHRSGETKTRNGASSQHQGSGLPAKNSGYHRRVRSGQVWSPVAVVAALALCLVEEHPLHREAAGRCGGGGG